MGARTPTGSASAGFTYIALLIAVAGIGIGLAAAGSVSQTMQMRDKERHLLAVGDEFRRAIGTYYEKSPGAIKQFPKRLEDLLRDERYPTVQRYLRKIYHDPLTGKTQWGLVQVEGLGITGVYSLSDLTPIQTANFPLQYASFKGAEKYSAWKFVYVPAHAVAPPALPQRGDRP